MITWLALTSDPPSAALAFTDKVNHIGAFLVLAFLADNAFPKTVLWSKLAGLAAYGIVLEVLQFQTGYRVFEVSDIVADVAGLLAYWPMQRWLADFPARLMPD